MEKPIPHPANDLRLRDESGGDESTWKPIEAFVVTEKDGTFAVVKSGSSELQRVQLEATTNVFETVLGESTFEIVTSTDILHFSAASKQESVAWVKYVRSIVCTIDSHSVGAIYKECNKRNVANVVYDVIIQDDQPLGVVLERCSEWALVKDVVRQDRGIQVGSAIIAIDGESVTMNKYHETLERLRKRKAPTQITLRGAPYKSGYLMKHSVHRKSASSKAVWMKKFFVLKSGVLHLYETDDLSDLAGVLPLMGSVVSLVPFEEGGRSNCFRLLSGVTSISLVAESINVMFDWVCAIYYGIALANGGGYLLATEIALVNAAKNEAEEKSRLEAAAERLEAAKAAAAAAKERALADAMQAKLDEEARVKAAAVGELAAAEVEVHVPLVEAIMVTAVEEEQLEERREESVVQQDCSMVDEAQEFVLEEAMEPEVFVNEELVDHEEEFAMEEAFASESIAMDFEAPLEEPREMDEEIASDVIEPVGDAGMTDEDDNNADNEDIDDAPLSTNPRGLGEDCANTDELKIVFGQYARSFDSKAPPTLNAMLFSKIFRLATKEEGNMYKEMQYFNIFDGGKGFMTEEDFISGWKEIGTSQAGSIYLTNLKRLAKEPRRASVGGTAN